MVFLLYRRTRKIGQMTVHQQKLRDMIEKRMQVWRDVRRSKQTLSRLRFGATENLWSYDEVAAFRASRPNQGLGRRIVRQVIQTFGRDFATASVQFEREGRPGWVGRQQQTWVRTAAGWRVVAAHVSFMGLPAA